MKVSNRVSIRCPHCGAFSSSRTSRQLSLTLREIYYQCSSLQCGHTFVANLEVVRTLSPSATPNNDIRIPIAEHTAARMMQQLALI